MDLPRLLRPGAHPVPAAACPGFQRLLIWVTARATGDRTLAPLVANSLNP